MPLAAFVSVNNTQLGQLTLRFQVVSPGAGSHVYKVGFVSRYTNGTTLTDVPVFSRRLFTLKEII